MAPSAALGKRPNSQLGLLGRVGDTDEEEVGSSNRRGRHGPRWRGQGRVHDANAVARHPERRVDVVRGTLRDGEHETALAQ